MTIEALIADTIRESIEEAVKNAVSEALAPLRSQLDLIEEKVKEVVSRVNEFPTEEDMRQAAAESIDYSLSELQDMVRNIELNEGRAQIREARALGRIA